MVDLSLRSNSEGTGCSNSRARSECLNIGIYIMFGLSRLCCSFAAIFSSNSCQNKADKDEWGTYRMRVTLN